MAEGFHDFTAGEVLTAANTDDYLMRQTIMRFASAATRDSALSGVLVEGLMAYTKDLNRFWVYTGSAWQLWSGSLPRCRAGNDVTQVVGTSAFTELLWDSEASPGYDTDTIHSTASNTGRFTIPAGCGGLWHFETSINISANTAIELFFTVNGAAPRWGQSMQTSTWASAATSIPVAAGDYVQCITLHTAGSDRTYGGDVNNDYLACHFIGPTY